MSFLFYTSLGKTRLATSKCTWGSFNLANSRLKKYLNKNPNNWKLYSRQATNFFNLTIDTIGRDLGKGTFGKVKVGTHVLTGEKVAVKILEKEKIVDVSDVERVAREIHILKIVRHP